MIENCPNSASEQEKNSPERQLNYSLDAKCSFYNNVRSKQCSTTTLQEFVTQVREGRWKVPVEQYRLLLSQGKEADSQQVKNNLPAIMASGYSPDAHRLASIQSVTGDAMFDIDKTDNRIHDFLRKLHDLPWVKAGWVSVSGDGGKVVVEVRATTMDDYRKAYRIVAGQISKAIGFPCDMQCKDLSRLCFASYDPNAFYKPDAEAFNWHAWLETHPEDEGEMPLPPPPAMPVASPVPVPLQAEGMIAHFFHDFCRSNPFVKGKRNNWLLKLGRTACYKGVNRQELKQLISLAQQLADETCTLSEIYTKINAGYDFAEAQNRSDLGRVLGQGQPLTQFEDEDDLQTVEDEEDKGDKIIQEVPYIPDEVYEELPDLLKRGLKAAKTRRELDILLLGMLANLSGCMPKVKAGYHNTTTTPHLYFLTAADPGSGKGVLSFASILPNCIQHEMDREYKAAEKEYRQKELDWKIEMQKALKAHRSVDLSKEPQKPVRKTLKAAANTSKNYLIEVLSENDHRGIIININELDTLSSALKRDYGDFHDVLRLAFQAEGISSGFKINDKIIRVYEPHIALCGSGTPGQVLKLIPSDEDGLFSRFLFYIGQQKERFIPANPALYSGDGKELFEDLSKEVKDMYHFLMEHPTTVKIYNEDWDIHTETFSRILDEVVLENIKNAKAVVYRYGLLTVRLASILTAMRKFEEHSEFNDRYCTHTDFKIALAIVTTLHEHALVQSTRLKKDAEVKPAHSARKWLPILDEMPNVFTYTDFLEKGLEMGYKRGTVKTGLKRLLKMEYVKKQGVKYVKTNKWKRK